VKTPVETEPQTPQVVPLPKVFVVDDEADVFDLFQRYLPPSHYAVTYAVSGHQALQLAAEHEFDLAFVDYFLAEMNGAEVAQKMRKLQPKLKVVLMSCYPVSENVDVMTELAGASAWISKPLNSSETRGIAEQVLHA